MTRNWSAWNPIKLNLLWHIKQHPILGFVHIMISTLNIFINVSIFVLLHVHYWEPLENDLCFTTRILFHVYSWNIVSQFCVVSTGWYFASGFLHTLQTISCSFWKFCFRRWWCKHACDDLATVGWTQTWFAIEYSDVFVKTLLQLNTFLIVSLLVCYLYSFHLLLELWYLVDYISYCSNICRRINLFWYLQRINMAWACCCHSIPRSDCGTPLWYGAAYKLGNASGCRKNTAQTGSGHIPCNICDHFWGDVF